MVVFNFEAAAERFRVAASALAAVDLARLVEAWRDPTAWEGETTVGELTLANAQWARVGYDELVLHGWELAATILQTYEPGTEEFDVIEPFIEETAAEPAQRVWGTLVQCRTGLLPVRTTPRVVRLRPELVAPAPRLIVRRCERSVLHTWTECHRTPVHTAGTAEGAFRARRPHRHHTETSDTPTNAATE